MKPYVQYNLFILYLVPRHNSESCYNVFSFTICILDKMDLSNHEITKFFTQRMSPCTNDPGMKYDDIYLNI